MLNKNMHGKLLSNELLNQLNKAVGLSSMLETALRGYLDEIFNRSRGIISIPNDKKHYFEWSKDRPSKHGFKFDARFDFWAESKKGMEGVAFITSNGMVVLPIYRDNAVVYCIHLASGNKASFDIDALMPLFPRAVLPTLDNNYKKLFNKFQDTISDICDARTDWLNGKGTYPRNGGRLDPDYNGRVTPAEAEAISELDEDDMHIKLNDDSSWSAVGRRGMGNDPRNKNKNPWATSTPEGKQFITREMLEKAMVKEAVLNAQTIKSDKGTEDMTKAAQVKTGMINVNKEALKQVGYLNAGRASNKLIKESVRPLLNAMFKPTFMQKIAMKLFKMENPVDVALKSGMSDLLCAQMVQAIVEIKGVENQYVREVTQAGITQAGYELSKAIPFEDAIDKVVANLEKGAEGIVAKISK